MKATLKGIVILIILFTLTMGFFYSLALVMDHQRATDHKTEVTTF
jgi:hypothetical protein